MARLSKIPDELKDLVLNPTKKTIDIKLEEKVDKKGNPIVVGQGFVINKDLKIEEEDIEHECSVQWFVIQSYAHAARQKKAFNKRLKKAEQALAKLKPKTDEDKKSFQERAEQIIKKYSCEGVIEIKVKNVINYKKSYKKPGHPTSITKYELIKIRQLKLSYKINQSVVEETLALAGWRFSVSNTTNKTMTLELRYRYYRDEWLVERSFHSEKKGKLPIKPKFLRLPKRIKGLMLLLTVALQVFTLMEFVIRRELAQQEETLSGLVPGNPSIKTARPTASILISQFNYLHLIIIDTGKRIKGHLTFNTYTIATTYIRIVTNSA